MHDQGTMATFKHQIQWPLQLNGQAQKNTAPASEEPGVQAPLRAPPLQVEASLRSDSDDRQNDQWLAGAPQRRERVPQTTPDNPCWE